MREMSTQSRNAETSQFEVRIFAIVMNFKERIGMQLPFHTGVYKAQCRYNLF